MAEKFSVPQMVTDKIIEKLENGTIPWQKPWVSTPPINYVSRKMYRGINLFLLERGGEYLTWNQIQDKKGKVKKGAKSEIIVFFTRLEITDDEGNEKNIPFLRYYKVFHLDDVEGIESKLETPISDTTPIQECENVIKNYNTCPKIKHGYNQAYYSPSEDIIAMPNKKQFKGKEEYYSTLFHEATHSTGHKSRLNRFAENKKQVTFGSEEYSKEELVAEICSAMLCCYCGIEKTIDNQTSYIANWLQVLKNDKNFIIQAGSKAHKAYDYILGI